jgi:hypothetical protein
VNLAGIRVILDRIDPPTGRLQALAPKGALGMMVSLRWAQARLVLAVCHSGPERWAAAGGQTLMAYGGTTSQASASWLMVPAAGAGTMGVWRSASSWTGPSRRPAVFG